MCVQRCASAVGIYICMHIITCVACASVGFHSLTHTLLLLSLSLTHICLIYVVLFNLELP